MSRQFRTTVGAIESVERTGAQPTTDRASAIPEWIERGFERYMAARREDAAKDQLARMLARLKEELPKAVARLREQRRRDELERLFAEVDQLGSKAAMAERALHDSQWLREYMGIPEHD